MSSIAQLLSAAGQRLAMHDTAALDAEVLLARVLDKPRSHLHAWPEKAVDSELATRYRILIERRAQGEPVAHLTGQREFWSLDLEISRDTLIPRPDTESLVERALDLLDSGKPLRVADLGTGSGAIALALASERRNWQLYAVDRSVTCVQQACRNAQRLHLPLHVLVGHWSDALTDGCLDAIVSNPPYVCEGDPHLDQGDVRFEPRSALVAGADGLDDIRHLADDAGRVLRPGGRLLLEHGPDQSDAIHTLLKSRYFIEIQTSADLSGRPRVTNARTAR